MNFAHASQPIGSMLINRDEAKDAGPLVTVIAVCYNQGRYLVECLESIRKQTYQNIELIIVDDCSYDNSVALIRGWLDATGVRATVITHSENQGICRTFNEAVRRASGKYVSIVAADDVYLPNKTEVQVEMFERLPATVGVIYSDAWQMDADGNPLPEKFIESHRKFQTMPEGNMFPVLLEGNFIPAMTTLIHRQCYETVGLYDEKLVYEDYDMWLRISRHYSFAFSPVIAATYRVVPTSMTRVVLQKSSVALRSDFRIFEKCARNRELTASERQRIKFRLTVTAIQMYARKAKHRIYYLIKLFRHDPRKYTFVMLLAAAMGIPLTRSAGMLSRWDCAHEPFRALTS
jgi:glycosyltransferase involved in cell wall biosynthesis